MRTVTLVGAGGKMGNRITDNLKDSEYQMFYLEVSSTGIEDLQEKGLSVSKQEDAIPQSDLVILAVPDIFIGKVSAGIVPQMKSGAILLALDPAAPLAGHLPKRDDLTYMVVHPCHPSVFNYEPTEEAHRDYFGGITAKQNMVCALMQGPEDHYSIGETVSKKMFAPIINCHRVTVDQMGILEPALSETLCATCLSVIKKGMEEAVRRGVPEAAARDFVLGHINVELAILFGQTSAALSDAAQKAVDQAESVLFKEDWKKIFEPENVQQQILSITN